jgi:hypothetical protein
MSAVNPEEHLSPEAINPEATLSPAAGNKIKK